MLCCACPIAILLFGWLPTVRADAHQQNQQFTYKKHSKSVILAYIYTHAINTKSLKSKLQKPK